MLSNSNRMAVRLMPCDVLARVGSVARGAVDELEIEVARQLAAMGSPVATLDPRVEPGVYVHGGFGVTLWTYYEPASAQAIEPGPYAEALARFHAGMREVHVGAPHFTDRVAEAERLVGDRAATPDLGDADRELLLFALQSLTSSILERGTAEQLLHGEPHPGNVLSTKRGLLFVDLETCCRGPVEFDVAHAPEEVSAHYPEIDQSLVGECRMLMRAMVAAWRWDREDRFPNGRRMGTELISELRTALDAP